MVHFQAVHFYNVINNLYMSDVIPVLNKEELAAKGIVCVLNFTKVPMADTHHFDFAKHCYDMAQMDKTLGYIFNALVRQKGVLVFCENGYSKTVPVVLCFLLKYYNPDNILDLSTAIEFLQWKTGLATAIDTHPYLPQVQKFRHHLLVSNKVKANMKKGTYTVAA